MVRIVSLLPSATEILYALGLADAVVAVTHECDYPPEARTKPQMTRSLLRPEMTSREIDVAVSSQLTSDAHSLYSIDRELLARLAPDLIVTQALCEVCAVDYDEVLDAVKSLPKPPRVLNLEPSCLQDMLDDIVRVGEATGRQEEAAHLVRDLTERIERVAARVSGMERGMERKPRVGFLEWLDPLFCGGHWNPELVELAGGEDAIGQKGQDSVRISWERVRLYAPEVLVISCCGFSAERTRQELPALEVQPGYDELPAVKSGRVHVVDGAAYFSRPGPRLVDSLEMLARFVHPELY